jgi:hypothetical protein
VVVFTGLNSAPELEPFTILSPIIMGILLLSDVKSASTKHQTCGQVKTVGPILSELRR